MARTETYTFAIDPVEDRDLKQWLESHGRGERSAAIRDALRAGGAGGAGRVTLLDIWQAIQDLKRAGLRRAGPAAEAGGRGEDDLPDDIFNSIKDLGL